MQRGKIGKVSLCGCGWFGLPLAKHFVRMGIETWGSKQSAEQAKMLGEYGIRGVPLALSPSQQEADKITPLVKAFFETDLLVINVPPGRHEGAATEWVRNIKWLSDTAKQLGTGKVVFISSTAVYGECQGKVDEATEPRPNTLSGKAHLEVEQYLLAEWGKQAVVMRFAGLIGPRRHPVRFLSGREGIEHGKDRVNLIHLDDCVKAISQLVSRWPSNQILHLASPQHPTREEYYCKMAQLAGLPLPGFSYSADRNSKVIDAGNTCQWLSISLDHESLLSHKPDL